MFWRSFCCPTCTRDSFTVQQTETHNKYQLDHKDMAAVVQVEQGTLEGVVCGAEPNKYIAFKGVPYAKPPVGKLRFKAPEPPEAWQGVRRAAEHGPVCPQYNERLDRIEPGAEDCLYLNIYTTTLTPSKPLAVMFWIHGGGFYTGSGDSDYYGPEFFMQHNVILVTINYRLEVLGFLCLDNEEVPGNAGLKDQVLALKWVKRNISNFGGDSNNITIFGCSAGSASTSYHLVSEMSQGLFNKAICQSGVCINEWSTNLYARERAFQLGKLLGHDTEDPDELLEFLRNVPVLSLVNIKLPMLQVQNVDLADAILFSPVIEKSHLNVEKFIEESPLELLKMGKTANIPLIVGYTSGEGIEIARNLTSTVGYYAMEGAVLPRELKLKWTSDKIRNVDTKIRDYYFGGKVVTKEMTQETSSLETDRLFLYNIVRYARLHARFNSSPVYLYKFTAETERNYTKRQYRLDTVRGACHADDLPYLFNVTCLDIPLTEESKHIISGLVRRWVLFATTGNPTSSNEIAQWLPYTDKERNCFIIGKEMKCVQNEDVANISFWENIYEEVNLNGDLNQNVL